MTPTYDRPVEAKLVVRLDNDEEWDAKPEDLKRFGLVDRNDAYMAVHRFMTKLLGDELDDRGDLTKHPANCVRYMVERLVSADIPFDGTYDEDTPFLAELKAFLNQDGFFTDYEQALIADAVREFDRPHAASGYRDNFAEHRAAIINKIEGEEA